MILEYFPADEKKIITKGQISKLGRHVHVSQYVGPRTRIEMPRTIQDVISQYYFVHKYENDEHIFLINCHNLYLI